MKSIITLIFLVFITTNLSAQIGMTKSKIIQEHPNYTLDKSNDGTEYIKYEVEFENYRQIVACYLTDEKVNNEQLCYQVLIVEPSSETNNWIKYFNEQNYVKLEGMTWKDYEHSIVYKVLVEDGSCLVTKKYDTRL